MHKCLPWHTFSAYFHWIKGWIQTVSKKSFPYLWVSSFGLIRSLKQSSKSRNKWKLFWNILADVHWITFRSTNLTSVNSYQICIHLNPSEQDRVFQSWFLMRPIIIFCAVLLESQALTGQQHWNGKTALLMRETHLQSLPAPSFSCGSSLHEQFLILILFL